MGSVCKAIFLSWPRGPSVTALKASIQLLDLGPRADPFNETWGSAKGRVFRQPLSPPHQSGLAYSEVEGCTEYNSSLNSAASQEESPLLVLRAMPSGILGSRMAEVLYGFHLNAIWFSQDP